MTERSRVIRDREIVGDRQTHARGRRSTIEWLRTLPSGSSLICPESYVWPRRQAREAQRR